MSELQRKLSVIEQKQKDMIKEGLKKVAEEKKQSLSDKKKTASYWKEQERQETLRHEWTLLLVDEVREAVKNGDAEVAARKAMSLMISHLELLEKDSI